MRRRGGFTLIEMIITIAIAPVLFGAVFAISGFAAQSNRRSATNQDIQFRAQAILENIKARKDTEFLTEAADSARPVITGFTDKTITDESDPNYEAGLTVYEQTAEIMGQSFLIRVEDRASDAGKVSREISPEISSLLLPGGASDFSLVFRNDLEVYCEYNGERFFPYTKANSGGVMEDHFYLIVQGKESGGTALNQNVTASVETAPALPRKVVLNIVYPKDALAPDAGSLNFTTSLAALPFPGFESEVVLIKDRVNFPETLDWAAVNAAGASRMPEDDLTGWVQLEEHEVTLTFTDTSAAPREWSGYETGYETTE